MMTPPSGPVPGFRQALSRADNSARSRMDQNLDGKKNPQEVNYRPSDDPTKKCDICVFFIQPDSCQKVAGKIDENAVCDLFKADDDDESKEAESEDATQPGGMT